MGIEPTITRLKVLRSTTELGGTGLPHGRRCWIAVPDVNHDSLKTDAPTRDRTEDLAINNRSLYQQSSGGNMRLGFRVDVAATHLSVHQRAQRSTPHHHCLYSSVRKSD